MSSKKIPDDVVIEKINEKAKLLPLYILSRMEKSTLQSVMEIGLTIATKSQPVPSYMTRKK